MTAHGTVLRPTLVGWVYVLGVAVASTIGFTTGSTPTILLAAALALPTSIAAVPAYYVVYGLLALVPGANPSSSTGSGSCAPDGDCVVSRTGDAASWFVLTTDAVGILALTAAALVNAVVLRHLVAVSRRTSVSGQPAGRVPPGRRRPGGSVRRRSGRPRAR